MMNAEKTKENFIWYLTAQDIHVTHRKQSKMGVVRPVESGTTKDVEITHFYATKLFFDTKAELDKYVAWHLRKYNPKVPIRAKMSRDELYHVVKIDTLILKNYEKVFVEKSRTEIGKTEYSSSDGFRTIAQDKDQNRYNRNVGIATLQQALKNSDTELEDLQNKKREKVKLITKGKENE